MATKNIEQKAAKGCFGEGIWCCCFKNGALQGTAWAWRWRHGHWPCPPEQLVQFRPPCTRDSWKTRTKKKWGLVLPGTTDSVRLGPLCTAEPLLDIFHVREQSVRMARDSLVPSLHLQLWDVRPRWTHACVTQWTLLLERCSSGLKWNQCQSVWKLKQPFLQQTHLLGVSALKSLWRRVSSDTWL